METLEDVISCETVSRVPLKLAQPLFCLVCRKKKGGLTKFRNRRHFGTANAAPKNGEDAWLPSAMHIA